MTIIAFVPDLMDRSKVAAAAEVTFVARPGDLAAAAAADDGARLVIVDLTRPGVLEALADVTGSGVRVIGFANHTRRDLMDSALAAGCDEVMARSAFFSRLGDLIGQ